MCDDFMIFMKTLEAYEKDVFNQLEFLRTFCPQKPLSKTQQKNVIFSGMGDSFASAMLAEVFSNYLVKSFDPLDLLKNKIIAKNKTIYLISISGNTISNIKVAKISFSYASIVCIKIIKSSNILEKRSVLIFITTI